MTELTRRSALAALASGPFLGRGATAANPIRIGMPLALTGPLGSVGEQQRRGAELWAKTINPAGGILGRPVELLITDTGGDPATCVRKARELVEREGCRLLFGMTLSSEALAVVPKLAEWGAIFVSSDNGDGRLTGESLVPNFFRANISGPMGARAADMAAVGAREDIEDLAQRGFLRADQGTGIEHAVQIHRGQAVVIEIEVGHVDGFFRREGIDGGFLVAAKAIGVDQLQYSHLLQRQFHIAAAGDHGGARGVQRLLPKAVTN